MKRSANTAMPKPQKAVAAVNDVPKEALAHTAQKSCNRCLLKTDVVYTTLDTGGGYVATCSFSAELAGALGIHEGVQGVVAPTKKAAEHSAASAVLSALGLEHSAVSAVLSVPKQTKGSTNFAPTVQEVKRTVFFEGEFDGALDYKNLLLRQLQNLFPKEVRTLSEGTDLIYTTQPCGPASASWQGCVHFPCLEELAPCTPISSPVPSAGEAVSKKKSIQLAAFAALRILSTGPRPILPPQVYLRKPRRAKNAASRVYALFKPRGMTATMSTDPANGGPDMAAWIGSILPGSRLCIIGGLDKNASGLLLVTTDGQFAKEVSFFHGCEKEFWCGVDVASNVDADALAEGTCAQLLGGFERNHVGEADKFEACAREARQLLPDEAASALSHAGGSQGGTRLHFSVTLDIRSFQVVKRMMAAAGVPTASQHLERIGSLRLADLQLWQPGSHVELSGEDVELLRSSCV